MPNQDLNIQRHISLYLLCLMVLHLLFSHYPMLTSEPLFHDCPSKLSIHDPDVNYDQSHFQILLVRVFVRSYCLILCFTFSILFSTRISLPNNLNTQYVRLLLCGGIFKGLCFQFLLIQFTIDDII